MSVWKRPTTAVYGTLTVVAGLRSDVNYVSLINPYLQMWTFFLKCFYFMQNSKGRPTVATGQWPTEGRDHLALNENVCILKVLAAEVIHQFYSKSEHCLFLWHFFNVLLLHSD